MTNGEQSGIEPSEVAWRRRALDQAEHSGNMEGLQCTGEARADAEDYSAGRIDIDELVTRGRNRYGLT